ncbi:hypothetical protein PF008_g28087 [Phytophthora fragariae]|uniref:Uncharacterized protein n=1 Tax=Phytophthora fragariae TaxID=53985 RepID=A0A6G0QCF5_9STRA|nr:hypothetical protein PF008_g28087 [Phytophthora fragariae]
MMQNLMCMPNPTFVRSADPRCEHVYTDLGTKATHATVELNAVTRTTASLLRRRRGQAQSASGSCAVTTAHLFQAPNVIRSPVAVLARFYLAPAHLYQPRKSFEAPQRRILRFFCCGSTFSGKLHYRLRMDLVSGMLLLNTFCGWYRL